MKETKIQKEIRKVIQNVESQGGKAKRYNNDTAILLDMKKPGDGESRYLLEITSAGYSQDHEGLIERTMSFIQIRPQTLCAMWAVLDEHVRTGEFYKELLKSLVEEIKTIPIRVINAPAHGDTDGDQKKVQNEEAPCQ